MTKKEQRRHQRWIDRMKEQYAGRIVNGCDSHCFTCQRLVVHVGGCSGLTDRSGGESELLPLCHVHFRTGRMEYPLGADNQLIPGQERFWKVTRRPRAERQGRRLAVPKGRAVA